MKAMDLMTHGVERIPADSDMSQAAAVLWTHDIGAVVVVDAHDRPVGVITDRDVAMAAFIGGRRLADIRVSETLQSPLVTCEPDDSVAVVAALMRDHHVRRVVVTDELDHVVGIVSITDLAKAATHRLAGVLDAPAILRAVEAAGTHR
jgi:CBS domain-containing protein